MLPEAPQIAAALATLGAVVLLILIAGRGARLLPAFRRVEGQAALKLCGTLALDARRRLHLVEADGQRALVLTGGGRDVLIAWPDTPPPGSTPP
jgi:flagellar biogenesis protein FliO